MIKKDILEAARAKFNADYLEAKTQIKIYTESPSGIGEHPQIVEEVVKLVKQMQEAKDCMSAIDGLITLQLEID